MRVCVWCLRQGAWTLFANDTRCFLCEPKQPEVLTRAPSHLLTEAEEREYRRISRLTGGAKGYGDILPHSRDLEALAALRRACLEDGRPLNPGVSGEGDSS